MLRMLGVLLLAVGFVSLAAVDSALAQGGRGGRGQGGPGQGGPGGGPGGVFGGGPGGMMGGGMQTAMLLSNPQVREQLELSDDQIRRLEGLQQDMREDMRDMFQNMRDGGGRGDMQAEIQKMTASMQKEIDGVLLKHQRDQLVALQASMTMGRAGAAGVLGDPNLSKQLGLSDEEAEKFRKQAEELRVKQEEEIQKLRDRYNERIIGLLPKEAQDTMREWMKTEVPEFNLGDRGGQQREGQQRGGQQRNRNLDF